MTGEFDPIVALERDKISLSVTVSELTNLSAQEYPDSDRVSLLRTQEAELGRRIDLCTGIVEGRFVMSNTGIVVPAAHEQVNSADLAAGDIAA